VLQNADIFTRYRQPWNMRAVAGDDGHTTADQVSHQRRQAIEFALQPVVLDRHVLALDIAGFAEAFAMDAQLDALPPVSAQIDLAPATKHSGHGCEKSAHRSARLQPPSRHHSIRRAEAFQTP
jgi:hypothetical protein